MIAAARSAGVIIQPPAAIHFGAIHSQDLVQEQSVSLVRGEESNCKSVVWRWAFGLSGGWSPPERGWERLHSVTH